MVGSVARGGEKKQKFHGKCIRTHLGSARHAFALTLRRAWTHWVQYTCVRVRPCVRLWTARTHEMHTRAILGASRPQFRRMRGIRGVWWSFIRKWRFNRIKMAGRSAVWFEDSAFMRSPEPASNNATLVVVGRFEVEGIRRFVRENYCPHIVLFRCFPVRKSRSIIYNILLMCKISEAKRYIDGLHSNLYYIFMNFITEFYYPFPLYHLCLYKFSEGYEVNDKRSKWQVC